MKDVFHQFAAKTSAAAGSAWMFLAALLVIVIWAVSGPLFRFSDTWQLVINTGTTIITFLMVFLVQNTQNRDARALHLKLDELLRASRNARTGLVNLESLSDDQLDKLQRQFERLQDRRAVKQETAEVVRDEVHEELQEHVGIEQRRKRRSRR
jgi:low affinity Fe/Cu permease